MTDDDFKPRRDGWFEHVGTWGEVTVGTVIASQKRSERWEIIEQRHGQQIDYGHTLWMKAREQTTGAEYVMKPKPKTAMATILTQSPRDTETPPHTPPADAEAIALLVEKLGAVHLATHDSTTGEVTCPNYGAGYTHEGGERYGVRDEMEHLRFAHGIDTTDLEAMEYNERVKAVTTLHGRAHATKYQAETNQGGFPHRHVPEDMTMFTGKRS